MIGMVTTGKSFYHCLSYCIEDKQHLSEKQKLEQSEKEGVQHKERAEVIYYNQCFGDAKELTSQFSDVRKLNSRTEKPVLHLSLRLAPGETLTKNQLIEMGQKCAEHFKVDQNQYIIVLHKDTKEQHIHIVANRVGYDGKLASDSNSYLRMANLCRKLEQELHLKQVLNPRAFLPEEQRLIPRQDSRKERLKEDIRDTLKQVKNYDQFEQKMKSLGYVVLKARGIAFIDDKKVKIKGSEVGYSLMRIEAILAQKQSQTLKQRQEENSLSILQEKGSATGKPNAGTIENSHSKERSQEKEPDLLEKHSDRLLGLLMKPEQSSAPEPLLPKKRKRKRHRNKPSL
jgi:hypothetical protein